MRICLFTSSLNRGGAERVFVNLANHWQGLGHRVDFVVMSSAGGLLAELDESVNLVDLSQQKKRLPMRLAFIQSFARYLRENRPDQVFATLTYVTTTALWAAQIARYKGRVVVRQANSLSNQSNQSLLVRIWNWMGYHIAYRWADAILVNSKNSQAEIFEMLPELRSKVELIYNPVVVDQQELSPRDHVDVPVVLASGRFTAQKDYPTLLRACDLVRRQRAVKFLILGDGPDRTMMEDLIKELDLSDVVELVGYVSDTKSYYQQASVFVLSSKWEGFPNVLVEALAAGVPVVATDSKGASREITEPILPQNIVGVGDFVALAERIAATLELTSDPDRYRRYVRERFELPVIATQYLGGRDE